MSSHHTEEQLPIRDDITLKRGDDWTRMYDAVYIDPETKQPTSVDRTGWAARMQVRESDLDGAPLLLEITSDNGQIINGPQSGSGYSWQTLVHITAKQSALLPPGLIAFYDIEFTMADGRTKTWYAGKFCVEGDITR